MSRDSSGNYTLPAAVNPVVDGTAITANWANTTLNDEAVEITDSLSRSGKGGMLAPLRCVDGSAAAPGMSWTSETGSGFWREVGAFNILGLSFGGVGIGRFTNQSGLFNIEGESGSFLQPGKTLRIAGGVGGAGAVGGDLYLDGGLSNAGTGGALFIRGGYALAGTANGGAISIVPGAGAGGGNGGALTLTGGGTATVLGDGGAVTITGGASGTAGGTAAGVQIVGGQGPSVSHSPASISAGPSAAGGGGSISLVSGASTGGTPGDISLVSGSSTGAGSGADINLFAGASSAGVGGDVNLLPGNGPTVGRVDFAIRSDTANGAGAVTITSLRPAAVATATIAGWLTIKVGGTLSYIPYWR